LTKVTEKDEYDATTQVVAYTYDVFNRRIAKVVDTTSSFDLADAVIERYVYDDASGITSPDGGNVVLDFVDPDGDGSTEIALERRYLYGLAVDQILAEEDVTQSTSSADRVLWPLPDHLGTVRDLAKNEGTLGEHYKYDSFGQITAGDTSYTRYLYTAREYDEAVGLQYNRARWFSAETAQWVTEDPLGFSAGDTNVKRYVQNHSTGLIDPSGLEDTTQKNLQPEILLVYDANHTLTPEETLRNELVEIQNSINKLLKEQPILPRPYATAADMKAMADYYKKQGWAAQTMQGPEKLVEQAEKQFVLNGNKKIQLYILDHGSAGNQQIGQATMDDVNWKALSQYVDTVVFLGCNVGQGASACAKISQTIGVVKAHTQPVGYSPSVGVEPGFLADTWKTWQQGKLLNKK